MNIYMGVDRCGWVWWGAGTREGTKKNTSRVHFGSRRTGIGSYGRGNFPGHHVLGDSAKSVKNGYRWVQMGADE